MSLTLLSGPSAGLIALADAKLFLRTDTPDEDALIQSLVATSTLQIEAALGLALIHQEWRLIMDHWPANGVVELPLAPLHRVDVVRARSLDGSAEAIPSDLFVVDPSPLRPRIAIGSSGPPISLRPIAGIEIDFTAGFGALPTDVPQPIRHAALLLVAHWYETRDPALVGTDQARIPPTVSSLLLPYRRVSL